jgi:SAM-dependent methyltransferase
MFASLYDEAFSWSPDPELGTVDELVTRYGHRPIQRLVDIGAGTGRFAEGLIARCVEYIAVEPDADMRFVLERRLDALGKVGAVLIPSPFEDVILEAQCDVAVLLTDVISYVFPRARLRRFLASLAASIRPGALAIFDLAIFAGYPDEARAERWSVQRPDGIVTASCAARLWPSETDAPLRIEVLEFIKSAETGSYEGRREAILHAFTPSRLIEILNEFGFQYCGCGNNGVMGAPGELPAPGRAFMAFRRLTASPGDAQAAR